LHQASLRGLAIELMFAQDSTHIERQRQLLADFDLGYIKQLVGETKAKTK
jgi:hypothetical protein